MHGGWHQPAIQGCQAAVDRCDALLKGVGQSLQAGGGAVGFQFDDMQYQFVGPTQRARFNLVGQVSRLGGQELIGDGQDREGPAVDDHIFEFDADAFEEVQWSRSIHSLFIPLRISTRRMMPCMIRR